ncbi:unnamed protein product [Rhodiola kirilowii]
MSTDTKIHYTPCRCDSKCRKQCPCERRDTRCEKYCGCSKQCNNKYRGCYCVAERCRSNDCPCFVAERECDPDICRNCWVSYGDDTTGEPHKTRSCYNMNIFDGPSKKVYRGRSKVAGWGAFTTETISKDEFIGEYTGELVLQEVALEKQGDHPCTSYIFDLDDKYVIDAQHEGGVLKYVNHASNPNCYSKIIFVGGRRRIGFFATWNIEPYEELFIDYGPEFSPVWENINKVNHSPDGSKAAEPNSRQLRRRCATKLANEDAAPT